MEDNYFDSKGGIEQEGVESTAVKIVCLMIAVEGEDKTVGLDIVSIPILA